MSKEQDLDFMIKALMVSQKSNCCSQRIGAVITMPVKTFDRNGKQEIVSEGWNTTVNGDSCMEIHSALLTDKTKLSAARRPEHSAWSDANEIHAEMSAILNAHINGVVLKEATLYTTQSPCPQCVKHIGLYGWNGAISRVVYLDKYDRGGDGFYTHLMNHTVIVDKIEREELSIINFDALTLNNNEIVLNASE